MIEINKKFDKDQNQILLEVPAAEFDQLEKVLRESGQVIITEESETIDLSCESPTSQEAPMASKPVWDGRLEMKWIQENRDQYVGQWVALDGDTLIAHGIKARDVRAEARRKGVANPCLTHIEPGGGKFGGQV